MTFIPELPVLNADGTPADALTAASMIHTSVPLAAGAEWVTPWIDYRNYESVQRTTYSDVIGSSVLESSINGGVTVAHSVAIAYTDVGNFRTAIFPVSRGTHCRLRYTNGPTPQTKFFASMRFHGSPSAGRVSNLFETVEPYSVAQTVRNVAVAPLAPTSGSPFDMITRTGNALNVNVTNVETALGTSFRNIVGAGTTVVKAGAGRLRRIVVNGGGNSAAIYNNIVAVAPLIGTINLAAAYESLQYDLSFTTGLTIVTVGASANLTVVYD